MWIALYRKNVVRKIIWSVEKKNNLPKISLFLEIKVLAAAWDAVTTKTAANYFQKSKISSESLRAAIVEDNDPFKELEKEIG